MTILTDFSILQTKNLSEALLHSNNSDQKEKQRGRRQGPFIRSRRHEEQRRSIFRQLLHLWSIINKDLSYDASKICSSDLERLQQEDFTPKVADYLPEIFLEKYSKSYAVKETPKVIIPPTLPAPRTVGTALLQG